MAQRSTTEINVINGPSTEIEAVLIWVLIIIMFGSFAMFCLCCLERKRKNNIHPQRQKPLPPSPMKPRKRNVPKIQPVTDDNQSLTERQLLCQVVNFDIARNLPNITEKSEYMSSRLIESSNYESSLDKEKSQSITEEQEVISNGDI